jgi:hypothetical protein
LYPFKPLCTTGTCAYSNHSIFFIQVPACDKTYSSLSLFTLQIPGQYLFTPQSLCTTGTCASTSSPLSLFALQVPAPVPVVTSASLSSRYLWLVPIQASVSVCYRYLRQYLFVPQCLCSTGIWPVPILTSASLSSMQLPVEKLILASVSLHYSLSLSVQQVPVSVNTQALCNR